MEGFGVGVLNILNKKSVGTVAIFERNVSFADSLSIFNIRLNHKTV